MVFIQHTTKNLLNELGTGFTNPTIGNDKLISDNNDRGQPIINRNTDANSPYPYTTYVKKTCPDHLVDSNLYSNAPFLLEQQYNCKIR